MKLEYKAKKRSRIKSHGFHSITTSGLGYWFSDKDGKLKTTDECIADGEGYSSHAKSRCHSVKAFIRFINKNKADLPIAHSFILASRYIGHDVSWTKTK